MTTPCSLTTFSTPHLEKLHSGKVRDSFRVDEKTRLIVVSDRISAFDRVLECAVPGKGAVLNGIANFWFERTRTVVPNHLILAVDPQASLVREVQPIRVEMIVRAYITGSAWRGYKDGKRSGSGTYVQADGVTYVGDYVDGHRQGNGEIKYPNGDRFEGVFVNDIQEGPGILLYQDGTRVEVTYVGGKPSGKAVWIYPDGHRIEGEF